MGCLLILPSCITSNHGKCAFFTTFPQISNASISSPMTLFPSFRRCFFLHFIGLSKTYSYITTPINHHEITTTLTQRPFCKNDQIEQTFSYYSSCFTGTNLAFQPYNLGTNTYRNRIGFDGTTLQNLLS